MFTFNFSKFSLFVKVFQNGIVHISAARTDDMPAGSLLDRYHFIESLPEDESASASGKTVKFGTYTLSFNDDASWSLSEGKRLVTSAMSGTDYMPGGLLRMSVATGEKLIGFGDHERQHLLLNGQAGCLSLKYPIQHIPVPYYMSSNGYGLFFNTTRKLLFQVSDDHGIFGVRDEFLDLYIITGNPFDELIERWTELTGKPSIPAYKSFGLWVLLQTWTSGNEAMSIAKSIRDQKIPCDNLEFEPGWMENYYDATDKKEWNAERFRGCASHVGWRGGPANMVTSLKRLGFNTGLWLCSRWDYTYEEERRHAPKQDTADSMKMTSKNELDGIELTHDDPNVGHQPIYMDEVTDREKPWFEHLKKFADDGVRFFKLDPAWLINEFPDHLYGNGKTDAEMHNMNFLLGVRQTWTDYEAHTGKRAYGIAVGGWAGIQKYPGSWAGDTGGGSQSVTGLLQDAIMGHAFTTCDMSVKDIQGIHAGFMLPWALLNSWAAFNYPGMMGQELDDVFRTYSNLRSRLALYFYSLAYRSSKTGKAILRPLCLVYPEKDWTYSENKAFMIGDALLTTVYSGDSVRLPSGKWMDLWTGKIYTGNDEIQTVRLPAGRGGHLFLKEGELLPILPVSQHLDTANVKDVEWLLFPGKNQASFRLYLDDGDSLEYRSGKYAAQTVTADGTKLKFGEISGDETARLSKLVHTVRDMTTDPLTF